MPLAVETQGLSDLFNLIALLRSPKMQNVLAAVKELISAVRQLLEELGEAHPRMAAHVHAQSESDVVEQLARGERLKRIWSLIEGLRGRISPEEFSQIVALFGQAIVAPNNPAAWMALVVAVLRALSSVEAPSPTV